MRRASCLLLSVLCAFGCSAVLGIPSDVEREVVPAPGDDGGDAGPTDAPADTTPPIVDAADAADAADAEPPPLCDPLKDFSAPTPLDSINTAEEDGAARLSEDELTIYIDGVRAAEGASYGIWFATRTTLTDSFGPLQKFPSINDSIDSAQDEYAPNVTADGLTLVFERKNLATQNSDIYIATRGKKTDPFGPVSSVGGLNTVDYEGNPFVRGDTSKLWHVRKPTVDNIDISVATNVPGTGYVISSVVQNSAYDGSPVISYDGRTLYFSSDRGGAGNDGTNIWVTTRSSLTEPFGNAVPIKPVNSDANEYPGWISRDGCRLYFVSTRPGGKGQQDVYVATRPR